MRERGDLAGGAAAEGAAMATSPVVACICCGLRRQYAIEVTCLVTVAECAALFDLTRFTYSLPSAPAARSAKEEARFRRVGTSLTRNRMPSDQIEGAVTEFFHRRDSPMVTTKRSIKAKARTKVRAFFDRRRLSKSVLVNQMSPGCPERI